MVCLDGLTTPCTVLSFGVAYIFDFEQAMLQHGCNVWSFDPSMRPGSYRRGSNHSFHPNGIGTEDGEHSGPSSIFMYSAKSSYNLLTMDTIMKTIVKRPTIDVLRIDIEGVLHRVQCLSGQR